MTDLRAEKILGVLNEHGVSYVLIGGMAAALHGSITPTFDVDITPEMSADNLACLSSALDELDARIRVDGVPDGLPFSHDAKSLAGITMLNLVTRYGDVDIATQPTGIPRYEDWAAKATELTILGVTVPVADLDDIVKSKEAADRDKDRSQLPTLRALRDRLRRNR